MADSADSVRLCKVCLASVATLVNINDKTFECFVNVVLVNVFRCSSSMVPQSVNGLGTIKRR